VRELRLPERRKYRWKGEGKREGRRIKSGKQAGGKLAG